MGIGDPRIWTDPNSGIHYALWQEDGQTRRKTLRTRDQRIAQRRLNNFRRDMLAGRVRTIATGPTVLLDKFVKEFLEHIEARVSDGAYTVYANALAKAQSCWGNPPMRQLTGRHVERLQTDLLKAGLVPATVNKVIRHLKVALRAAIRWKYMPPVVEWPPMLKIPKRIRYLTAEQIRALLSAIDDPEFYDVVLLALYTGLRSGEILRLKFSDVDNPQGFLRISAKQKNRIESRIPINTTTRTVLERCAARRPGMSTITRFSCLTWVSQKFKKYAREAGLGSFRFHDLRHTFASHLTIAGEGIRQIQELMRHESLASTMVYSDLAPESLRAPSERLSYGPLPAPKAKGRR